MGTRAPNEHEIGDDEGEARAVRGGGRRAGRAKKDADDLCMEKSTEKDQVLYFASNGSDSDEAEIVSSSSVAQRRNSRRATPQMQSQADFSLKPREMRAKRKRAPSSDKTGGDDEEAPVGGNGGERVERTKKVQLKSSQVVFNIGAWLSRYVEIARER